MAPHRVLSTLQHGPGGLPLQPRPNSLPDVVGQPGTLFSKPSLLPPCLCPRRALPPLLSFYFMFETQLKNCFLLTLGFQDKSFCPVQFFNHEQILF